MTAADLAFRHLPFMGVIRVNEEAMKVGYTMGDPAWANLGQGQPEVGELDGAPPRMNTISIDPEDHAYGPVEGVLALREAVAAHYNRLYRAGKPSQYTAENVAIASGGRLALTRCGAALEKSRLGYFTPDYTAYEDLLTTFDRVTPIWIELSPEDGFRIDPAALTFLPCGGCPCGAPMDPDFSVIILNPDGTGFISSNTDDGSTVLATDDVNDILAQVCLSPLPGTSGTFEIRIGIASALADGDGMSVPFDVVTSTVEVFPNDADLDLSGDVGFGDLLIVLTSWGPCPNPPDPCLADINGSGDVGFDDLIIVLTTWGPAEGVCPVQ